jgi:hypothetical protein
VALEMSTEREQLASWMIKNGFSTGHGDDVPDLLNELEWQIQELRQEKNERSNPK